MPDLSVDDPSITYGVLGFYLVVISLISYWLKQKLFIASASLASLLLRFTGWQSGAVVSLVAGVIVGPYVLNWVNPAEWVDYNEDTFDKLTFEIMRVVIALQVLFTGISLPKAYLRSSWRSLAVLLLPVMTSAYIICGLLIWGLFPGLSFLESLCIGACITPTDPVLAASSVKGRFAEENVPREVRNLIVAESGANDGLGFPFLFLAIYLILRPTTGWSVAHSLQEWVLNTWLYTICLSIVGGAVIGYVARRTLKYAEQKRLIEHESFLAYGIGLALFCLGTVGLLGSDDLLSAFVAGNSFTWDDWYRLISEDHSFQDVIDSLLDSAVFIYIGTILPWDSFNDGASDQQIWRFIVFGILIMLVRRLPFVLLGYRFIPDLTSWKDAFFTGWFGPIGVSAIYYVQVALTNLPEERTRLRTLIVPVVYFAVLTSVLVHGTTISLTQLGRRTYTRTRSRGKTSGSSTPRTMAPFPGEIPLPQPPGDVYVNDMTSVSRSAAPSANGSKTEGLPLETAQTVHFVDVHPPTPS